MTKLYNLLERIYVSCIIYAMSRVFFLKNFFLKSLKFSKKENQGKSCGLMNKERQKQIRALFHLYGCYGFFSNLCLRFYCRHLFPVLDPSLAYLSVLYPPKTSENHMLFSAPRGHKLGTPSAKWGHYWLTQIWPNTPIPCPLETSENQRPSDISRGIQNRKIGKTRVKWQNKEKILTFLKWLLWFHLEGWNHHHCSRIV